MNKKCENENKSAIFAQNSSNEAKVNIAPLSDSKQVAGGFSYNESYNYSIDETSSYENKSKYINLSEKEKQFLQTNGYTFGISKDSNEISCVKDSSGKILNAREIGDALKFFHNPLSPKG